jgi:hypothetical protein
MRRVPLLERALERALGLSPGRLILEAELDIGIPGKSALAWRGDPELTKEEADRLEAALSAINTKLGGSSIAKVVGEA